MDLRLSDTQQSLQRTFAQFFAEECSPHVVRQMEHTYSGQTDTSNRRDLQIQIWQDFVNLGSTRLTLPTELGGVGWGQSEAIVISEQAGRALYQSPYLDILTAIDILQATNTTDSQQALLLQMAIMGKSIALAIREDGGINPSDLSVLRLATIEQAGGWAVTGEKRFVCCAGQVQYFLLCASSPDGPSFFLLPGDRAGITIRRHDEIGRGEFCALTFDAVQLSKDDLVGNIGGANVIYTAALAHARIRHAAYLVGVCRGLFEITRKYTEQRKQFGQSIAAFQSIAFRLASFVTRIEAAHLLTHYAAWLADQNRDSQRVACELLALVGDLTLEWTADALQMHGSYGLTEQSAAQGYYRRASVDTLLLGTPAQLRAEAAALLAVADTYTAPITQERITSTL